MTRTAKYESVMIPLGTEAPDFLLPDTLTGTLVQYGNVAGKMGTVVLFICNHCPFVQHINPEIVRIANDYIPKAIGFTGISSNDVEAHPDDSPDKMKIQAETVGYPFPYLYDETQQVAKEYDAACTPDIFVFDKTRKLVYRGRLDASRPNNDQPLNGKDLREVLEALVNNKKVSDEQFPSMGCSIKWK
jgi:thiol-disulfide isomerase/thioredoxin